MNSIIEYRTVESRGSAPVRVHVLLSACSQVHVHVSAYYLPTCLSSSAAAPGTLICPRVRAPGALSTLEKYNVNKVIIRLTGADRAIKIMYNNV
jgi:hypothetical protein